MIGIFHGLALHSALKLPSLRQIENSAYPPLMIEEGGVPDDLPAAGQIGAVAKCAVSGEVLLALPGIGRFLVSKGEAIRWQGDAERMVYLLLTWAFPVVLHQRGWFCLRASAVEWHGSAIVLCGYAGVGKSTAAARLLTRGARLIADGFVTIRQSPAGELEVFPGAPAIYLWRDALDLLGEANEALSPIRPGLLKYTLPAPEGAFTDQALTLGAVYIAGIGTQVGVTEIAEAIKLRLLLHHVPHREVATRIGMIPGHWQMAEKILRQRRVALLIRDQHTLDVDAYPNLIAADQNSGRA